MLAVPLITDQKPVPAVGVLAAIVAVAEAQSVWLGPATELEGNASRTIFTVDVVVGHTPLEMVH